MAAIDKIKPHVRAIKAYTLDPIDTPIKINQNENPFGMPQAIKDEALRRAAAHDWARYPDFIPTRLHEKLADYTGWRAAGVMARNGRNGRARAVAGTDVFSLRASHQGDERRHYFGAAER
jgi:histidinol-phosphate aminotransferase